VSYEAVIGLEVHAQLRTRSKMFCACPTDFGAAPNSQVCPVCLGHPGVLPVANRRAVELAVRFAGAVGARVNPVSTWARKNYFYPDLPKGYQITQYERPLAEGGAVRIASEGETREIPLVRLHLEEDAGRSRHPERPGETRTLVDLNRCGVPLIEIVSAPALRTPAEAHAYLAEMRLILRYCGVCDGDMEKGSLRCDANVSVRPRGTGALGAKTEVKNLNSLRAVERALAAEIARQSALLAAGGAPETATALWDPARGETRVMRTKEEAPDYRYFPEPDLPPLACDPAWIASIRDRLPELPGARRERLMARYGLRPYDAAVLTADPELGAYFERVAERVGDASAAAGFVTSALVGALRDCGRGIGDCPIAPEALAPLLERIAAGKLSHTLAKQVLDAMLATGQSAETIVRERGWEQVDDAGAIAAWVAAAIAAHPAEAAAYRAGKTALLGFFVGAALRLSGGRAHPQRVQAAARRALESEAGSSSGGGSQ
jgi:aspartyl-tRNA(Asn)/glutamyl-tRNA(Gln) amidotransferase subunit B